MSLSANICVRNSIRDSGGVFLYTFSGRKNLPCLLQKALSRRQRWYDAPYLTRIIFDEMAAGTHGEEIGFGISSYCHEAYTHVMYVCCNEERIIISDGAQYSFEEFLELPQTFLAMIWE